MTSGVAVSNPTTSSMPGSSGSAIESAFATIPTGGLTPLAISARSYRERSGIAARLVVVSPPRTIHSNRCACSSLTGSRRLPAPVFAPGCASRSRSRWLVPSR
jgi:hypothetical protein